VRSLEPTEDLAITLVRRFLILCESPRTRRTMLKMVRGSTGGGRAGRRFYRVINRAVLIPVLRTRGVQASAMKTELVASQLIGIGVLRYVVKVEPMASASLDEVIELAAPSIRATLRA
jgi:hypothetical protein